METLSTERSNVPNSSDSIKMKRTFSKCKCTLKKEEKEEVRQDTIGFTTNEAP